MNSPFLWKESRVRRVTRQLAHCGARLLATGLILSASVPASFAGSNSSASPRQDRNVKQHEERLVPTGAFHAAIAERQHQAARDRAELEAFLGRSGATLKAAGIEFAQVQQAIAALDDAQAARLAERARQANQDFAAGAFSNEMLTYIVIALATAVLVLVLVL